MNPLHTEEDILRKIDLLPRELAPLNDPWPEISGRIGSISRDRVSTARRARLWPFAVAAMVLLMASTMLISGRPWRTSSPYPALPGLARQNPGATTSAASEAEYHAAFREFMKGDAWRESSLQPSKQVFSAGWGALRQAEVELQVALNQEPDNIFLNSHLHALRARQLELLQQISAADMAAWRNSI